MRIILASASPRRKELLKTLCKEFEVIPATGAETYTKTHPSAIVQQLSAQKAAEIEQRLFTRTAAPAFCQDTGFGTDTACRQDTGLGKDADTYREAGSCMNTDYLIIGADTVVAFQGGILGKPHSAVHAEEMLRSLAGNVHQVYTGVSVILSMHGRRQSMEFAERTNVRFYPMTEAEIKAYVDSGEPMDKAGGYGIQGIGGRFVQGIEGDYQNVVGLPVAKLYQVLNKNVEFPLPF